MSWLVSETAWVRAGIFLFIASAALVLCGVIAPGVTGKRRRDRITDGLLLLSVAAIGTGIGIRWQQSGQGPFLTLYEILVSNLFSLGLFVLLAIRIVPAARPALTVALPMLAVLGIWTLFVPTEVTPLPPTFDNLWLWAHVLAGKFFLGAALLAAALSVLLLVCSIRKPGMQLTRDTEMLDAQVWRFAAVAFVFDSAMLVAGAAWARDAWGRYWAWDPLETWALLTWLALAIVLHARLGFTLPKWTGWVGMCSVFVLAFLTFFGVPFLSIAPHKGVM
ncbi:MAG: cytochrome c biogenesis protein CcsA [Betaproteobacteria bacterium]|nr:MAG: cytochrome c biogenesis protein CcsA [Betaproteobacteria bacterium]